MRGLLQEGLKQALYSACKSIWFDWYVWHPICKFKEHSKWLKTAQGAFEWFTQCLLDEGIRTDILQSRVVPKLREAGYLDYHKLVTRLSDPENFEKELVEVLGKAGHKMKYEGAKAIVRAVEVISKKFENNIHNIYNYALQKHRKDRYKVAEEVYLSLTRSEFYWMKEKKAGIFLRDMVGYGVWDMALQPIPPAVDTRVRRVLERLQLVNNRNNVRECRDAILSLASELNLTPIELDVALWTIGDEKICGEKKPKHDRCPLNLSCPSVSL
jgi:thermostable 8-oxoguanine DNA glycosylase